VKIRIFIISAAISLSACASVPIAQNTKALQTHDRLKGLSARVLTAGECGLFVWTADENKQFVLFSQTQKARANWLSPSGEIALSVTSQSGSPRQGQYPQQTLTAKDGGALRLDLRSPQTIENGTRYQAGTLSRSDAEGWDRVTPVVGLSACQSANG